VSECPCHCLVDPQLNVGEEYLSDLVLYKLSGRQNYMRYSILNLMDCCRINAHLLYPAEGCSYSTQHIFILTIYHRELKPFLRFCILDVLVGLIVIFVSVGQLTHIL